MTSADIEAKLVEAHERFEMHSLELRRRLDDIALDAEVGEVDPNDVRLLNSLIRDMERQEHEAGVLVGAALRLQEPSNG